MVLKISIVTATYNSWPYIKETYDSIVNQSYKDWEWHVTDDCSSDYTYQYLTQLADRDCRIIIHRNEINSGAAVARNKSLSQCSGDYIAFIDSDDLWKPEKLENQLNFMINNQLDFSFTGYEIIDESGKSLNKYVDINQTQPIGYEDMLKKKATLGCSTVMLRRLAFSELSMPNLRTGQDYALWLKLLKTGIRAVPYNKSLMKYRIVSSSISRNKYRKAKRQWQIYRELENLSFVKSVYCFLFYAWRAIFRK
ncbi:glycosyltransferase family 2 protein [Escherichia albertii]|uniref:glycosyltransferase family 2 protein n=1 Tax=Escherichia albertii TaxID=208962 RepID=UPI0007438A29|nr:glycosyltransferase family 2 protein [Escherichia albertii]MCE7712167.1 glycosyltransferase family 2 protein [Escherichia albertii]MCZ7513336.1 glycosyltransferase family 2 protein [Escherichia albertii]MCZ8861128.1 glycosyltransferase family 2 protein [Escherichia albertii]WDB49336.1 glycosyltransferase family 2 protein [Escherichia albertii]